MKVLVTAIICDIRKLFGRLYCENGCGSMFSNKYMAICKDECVCDKFLVCSIVSSNPHNSTLRMFGYLGNLVVMYTCSKPLRIGCQQRFHCFGNLGV